MSPIRLIDVADYPPRREIMGPYSRLEVPSRALQAGHCASSANTHSVLVVQRKVSVFDLALPSGVWT